MRDTDVLIYAVLVPILIYPTLMIGASELLLMQARGMEMRTSLQNVPDSLRRLLGGYSALQLQKSENPLAELQKHSLDLVISSKETNNAYEITAYSAGQHTALEMSGLRLFLERARSRALEKALSERGLPRSLLDVYYLNVRRLLPGRTPKVEVQMPLGALAIAIFGLIQIVLAAGVVSVCVLTEEREKNSYEATLTLPVPRWMLIAGKWGACAAIATMSALLNVLAMGVTLMGILMQFSAATKSDWRVNLGALNLGADAFLGSLLTVVLGGAFASAVCMATVSACRSFRDGQTVVTYAMLTLLILPMVALVPGIERNWWMSLLPLSNAVASLKHPALGPLVLGFAATVTIIWTVGALLLCARLFFDESALSGKTARLRGAQEQTESV